MISSREFLRRNKKEIKNRGFTLIESLVFMFLFSIISLTFLQVYVTGTQVIIDSKNRLGAVALANQKMEVIRSIEYNEIGTKYWNGSAWVYGVPAGDILQSEDVAVNGRQYHIEVFVQYVDDPFDRTVSSSPADSIPTDYKKVRVEASWGDDATKKVALFANFVPEGVETAVAGGTLSINVLKADGTGVAGASVDVTNTTASVSVNGVTDTTGNLTLPGMPASSQKYVISVSKNGYYGATTLPPYPTTNYTPVNVHASVVVNTLNQFSIIMDQSVTIPLNTVDPFDQDIASIQFSFSGGRLLGTHPTTGVKTYSLNDTNRTADVNGEYTYSNQSYGLYTFTLGAASSTKYELYKMLPESTTTNNQIDIAPGATETIKAVLLDKEIGSLKVVVVNDATGLPVSGASVRLQNTTLGYDATGTTDQFGWTYFPQTSTSLVNETYDISVSATGYNSKTDNSSISGTLVTKTVRLVAN